MLLIWIGKVKKLTMLDEVKKETNAHLIGVVHGTGIFHIPRKLVTVLFVFHPKCMTPSMLFCTLAAPFTLIQIRSPVQELNVEK